MRSRSLPAAGALTAALLLAGCTSSIDGSAAPLAGAGPAGAPAPAAAPDVRVVPLLAPATADRRAALLAPDGDDGAVALLRELSDEGGDLSTFVALGLITPEGPGSGPDEPGVTAETTVPAVDDPVLVAHSPEGGLTVLVGSIGEPGADVRFGFLVLTDSVQTVHVDDPQLADPDTVAAALSADGAVLYLLAQDDGAPAVLFAVDTADGAVLARTDVEVPGGGEVTARGLAAVPDGGVVAGVDVGVIDGGAATSATLLRWDADLEPAGEELALAPDTGTSSVHEVAVLDDGTAVAAVSAARPGDEQLRLVAVAGDVLTTVAELPDDFDPGGLAVDPDGGSAYLAVRERDTYVPTLVVADLAGGPATTVDLCRVGFVDDVAVAADGGVVWVSGVCDEGTTGPVVWAVG
ncbi:MULTISPECIES: hypothetical protein [unclassified Blastococcus]